MKDLEYYKIGLSILEPFEFVFNDEFPADEIDIDGRTIDRTTFFKEIKRIRKMIKKLENSQKGYFTIS